MLEAVHAEDRDLLAGLLRAERAATEQLYRRYLPGIVQYVTQHGGTEADARDIFQDLALLLYRKLRNDKLVLTASLRTYLLAVCRNMWRTRQRDRREYRLLDGEGEQRPDLDADTLATIESLERERVYRAHFDQLGERCQAILRGFFQKIKMRDLAAQLGLSEAYVKKRKFECKQQLIERIERDPRFRELRFDADEA
jgi:RNA polymerase sigma factor (sigma-70 family)